MESSEDDEIPDKTIVKDKKTKKSKPVKQVIEFPKEWDYVNLPKNHHLTLTKNIGLWFNKLPEEINVSVLVMSCKIGSNILTRNIGKYLSLHPTKVVTVKYASNKFKQPVIRTLLEKKQKRRSSIKKKKPKKKKIFVNQATVEVMTKRLTPVNVKLFNNGSMQMTGIKNLFDFCYVVDTLMTELKRVKAVLKIDNDIDDDGNLVILDRIIVKPFLENPDDLELTNAKVCMINTNFQIDSNINLENLHNKLSANGYTSSYNPSDHAGVNIKYNYKDKSNPTESKDVKKKLSIFVFESGSIMITGVTTVDHILTAYNFINKKMKEYGDGVVLLKINPVMLDKLIEGNEDIKKIMLGV